MIIKRYASRGSVRYEVFPNDELRAGITVERSDDLMNPGTFKSATVNWSACGAVGVEYAQEYRAALEMATQLAAILNDATIQLYRIMARTVDDRGFVIYESAPDREFLIDLYQEAGCTITAGPSLVPYDSWQPMAV